MSFFGYSWIFGYNFFVKFDFFKNNPDFWVYFINGIVECCLQCSCFLFSSVRFNEKNGKRIECLSNDSTVLISVLLCLYKDFHIVYNCYQFELSLVSK